MGVIHHQRQGLLRRQVGAQPVQPVQHRERRVRGDRRSRSHGVTQARKTQQAVPPPRAAHPTAGPAPPPTLPPPPARPAGAPPRTRTRAPAQRHVLADPETLSLRRIPGDRQQHGLADPSRPLHHQRSSTALPGPLQAFPVSAPILDHARARDCRAHPWTRSQPTLRRASADRPGATRTPRPACTGNLDAQSRVHGSIEVRSLDCFRWHRY